MIKELEGLPHHLRCDAVFCEGEDQWYLIYSSTISTTQQIKEAISGSMAAINGQWVTIIFLADEEPRMGQEDNRLIIEGTPTPGSWYVAMRARTSIAASKQHREICQSVEMGLSSLYMEAAKVAREQAEATREAEEEEF